ncbi:MAG: sensor histidine kinase [Caldilinea sp. CFX5]|nr:sensor histidine kinase [Caldilinea sp. CFX5]
MKQKLALPNTWLDWLALITVVVVAAFAFSFYPASDMRRWGVAALFLIFAAALIWPPDQLTPPTVFNGREHARLLFLTLVTLGMVALEGNFTAIIILYFLLSGRALTIFPDRTGYTWILALGGLTSIMLAYILAPDWGFGLLNGLGATCGYFFVGSAANAQRRAEAADAESRRLLQELQVAHQQLQAHAAHAEALAVAEERNRLAREMHDTLGHRLTVAAVQLEGAQKLVKRDPDKAVKMIGTVREQVLEGLTELRRTVAALRTPLEEDLPLRAALTRLTSNFMEATGIQTELYLPATLPDLPPDHRHALYRTAQEALTNIQRHAQATHARVEVALIGDETVADGMIDTEILITIADDGVGMNGEAWPRGYGLRGIEERAVQLGGEFFIHPRSKGGTRIVMSLPLTIAPEEQKAVAGNGVEHG